MSIPSKTQDPHTVKPRRKYRTEHWLLELVSNGNREKTILLEGRRKNIVSYIRSNTKYLFPFYEALFRMLDPMQGYDEIDMHTSIYEFFNDTCDPFLEINSKKIEDFLKSVPDRDIIQIFNAKAVDISNYPVLSVQLSRLPPSWNTRPRKGKSIT